MQETLVFKNRLVDGPCSHEPEIGVQSQFHIPVILVRQEFKQHGQYLWLTALAIVLVPYPAIDPFAPQTGIHVFNQPGQDHVGKVPAQIT